jgi:hypothetical protein
MNRHNGIGAEEVIAVRPQLMMTHSQWKCSIALWFKMRGRRWLLVGH